MSKQCECVHSMPLTDRNKPTPFYAFVHREGKEEKKKKINHHTTDSLYIFMSNGTLTHAGYRTIIPRQTDNFANAKKNIRFNLHNSAKPE